MTTTMTTQHMGKTTEKSSLIRKVLRANAIFSDVSGFAFILAAGWLAEFSGLQPPMVFTITGIILIGYAVWLWMSTRQEPSRGVALAVIALDSLWVVASIAALALGLLPLTVAGKWAVAIVADFVAVFAVVEMVAYRRMP